MARSHAKTLQYAGAAPYAPERDREDIGLDEHELLTQDDTYQHLAELRYLADVVEDEMACRDDVPDETQDLLFGVIADSDAPIRLAVEAYVDRWLAEHRSGGDA
ncbi:MAG: hypothetical protein ACOCY1_04910 [Halovenus sp.]